MKNHTSSSLEKVHAISLFLFLLVSQVAFFYEHTIHVFFNYSNSPIKAVLLFLLLSSFAYWIIFKLTMYIYSQIWKMYHKRHWIAGYWLHIHLKPTEVRIGYVYFEQRCEHITKSLATNIYPRSEQKRLGLIDSRESSWHYSLSRISIPSNTDLIGIYEVSAGYANTRMGTHTFTFSEAGCDYPKRMHGVFSDILIDQQMVNTGRLKLYKLTKKLEQFLLAHRRFSLANLANILDEPSVASEEYVLELKKYLAQYERDNCPVPSQD